MASNFLLHNRQKRKLFGLRMSLIFIKGVVVNIFGPRRGELNFVQTLKGALNFVHTNLANSLINQCNKYKFGCGGK